MSPVPLSLSNGMLIGHNEAARTLPMTSRGLLQWVGLIGSKPIHWWGEVP